MIIRGFRIPVAALPNLKVKGGMDSGPEIHGFRRKISVRCFPDFSTDTEFRHGAHVATGVPTFGSRSGSMGTKLADLQFNSSRSIEDPEG